MPDVKWPPIDWLWGAYAENRAWYSGDPKQLKRHTQGFWRGKERIKAHVPIAHEMASMAASMLFSGSPTITLANEPQNERLQQILDRNQLYARLLWGAELQAALGGVFLKVNWDKELAGWPILTVLPADAGLPRYQNGLLTGCTFWGAVRTEEVTGTVWRLREEYHADGRITSALFRGDEANIGREAALTDIPETRGTPDTAVSAAGRLLAVYVPGRLPNRFDLAAPYGMSDFHGLHSLFSALDETYSAMLRDVRHGKSRIVVPLEYLRRKADMFAKLDQQPASRWAFDADEEIFTALDINPQDNGAGLTFVQPALRAAEYQVAVNDLVRRIFAMAGYSPQSAGLDIDGRAESGTALNVRERRSLQTIDAKRAGWWHALREITEALLAVDKSVLHGPGGEDVTVTFADNTQPDQQTVAETLDKLERAGAASTDSKVRMLNPDWDDDEVAAEVRRIHEERGLTGGDPLDPMLGDMEAGGEA